VGTGVTAIVAVAVGSVVAVASVVTVASVVGVAAVVAVTVAVAVGGVGVPVLGTGWIQAVNSTRAATSVNRGKKKDLPNMQ
jgi:UPF0716 family protein affecting phage T7 exclusion